MSDLSGSAGWAGWAIRASAALTFVIVVDGEIVAGQTFGSLLARSARATIRARLASG